MKTPRYGYHASDSTLRADGVRMAKLTTPEGKVLSVATAKTITDALNAQPAKVHVLVIDAENNGLIISTHVSNEAALNSLGAWVDENWQAERGNERMPGNRDEAIAAYFDHDEAEDHYQIEACEVEG